VNSAKRIKLCSAAGAHSIDGTSATRFSKTLPRLDAALVHADRQEDFFSPQAKPIDETDFDCGWPFPPRR
jgi:predicted ABC-type ATPase